MTLLALTITKPNGIRMAEMGELLCLLGGVALIVGAVTRFGHRSGMLIGGLALALGFLLLILATHYGHFH